jgi:hypothetical protein
VTVPTSCPVVLFVFNRPDLTEALLAIVRDARPRTLLVVADGPRATVATDIEACAQVRAIATNVDWPCDVITEFAPENLGCERRVSSGITWAFELVDHAILLEDDIRPDPSFFGFCDIMLERYADDPRIMHVTGRNPLGAWSADSGDYLYARTGSIWGWATWRRAWAEYDVSMDRYRTPPRTRAIADAAIDPTQREFLDWMLHLDVAKRMDTWDIPWTMAMYALGGLAVVPTRNLVGNVGFRDDATHLPNPDDLAAALRVNALDAPYSGPPSVAPDDAFDRAIVWYERVRHLRRAHTAALAWRLARNPAARDALRLNPAMENALATFDDVQSSLTVLRHVQAHSRPWPAIDALVDELEALAP